MLKPKERYKIKISHTEIVEVLGSPTVIYGWLKTFIHKRLDSQPAEGFFWRICELTTGLLIAGGDTQKKATDRTREVLDWKGKDLTLECIAKNEKINPEERPVLLHRKPRKVIKPEQEKLPL